MIEFNECHFAAALLAYRAREGYGLRGVAAETGISASTLSRIEHGELWSLVDFVKLCNFAGLDPRDFFEDQHEMTQAEADRLHAIGMAAVHKVMAELGYQAGDPGDP